MKSPLFLSSTSTLLLHPLRATLIACALATALPVPALAQPDTVMARISFDVPPGPVDAALNHFGRQASVLLSVDAALTKGLSSPGVKGQMSIEAALQQLLSGTGFSAVRGEDNSYKLVRVDAAVLPAVNVNATTFGETTEGTASYTTGAARGATGLSLSLRDTPQSISVVTRERIQDQQMTSVDDALRATTGISVKATDRGRNSLSSRGFTINNFLIDGVPFDTGNVGIETASTAVYDRIEVVRGATGLVSGSGDPSATVNLVRKHANSTTPTGSVEVEAGLWDKFGGTVDFSTPLNSDASVRARFVARHSESEAFIDLENTETQVLYAVLDADLSERTYLTLGASYEKTERNGVYWGGLPYWFSEGTPTDWDRSNTTATRWNQWDTEDLNAFVTLEHSLDSGWVLSANASYYEQQEDSNLLWVTGEPDPDTGLGMDAYPYLYATNPKQQQFSVGANGPFSAWGREHEATFRILHSERKGGWDNGGIPLSPVAPVGNFFEWDGSYPAPLWDTPYVGDRFTITETALYAATRLQLTDSLKAIIGGRYSDWEREAEEAAWTPEAYRIPHEVFVPYLGVIYDLNTVLSAFASYSSIFEPQTYRDRSGNYLDPLEGDSYETGLKAEFYEGKLNATLALFAIRQDNFAVEDGNETVSGSAVQAYRTTEGVETDGYEVELAGALTPNWDINVGWTHFSAKDPEGEDVAEEHPRKMLRLFTKYHLQENWTGLSVGGGITWQDDEPRKAENPGTGNMEKVGEDAYALVDLMARYRFDQHWSLQLNVNNLLDEHYKESSWGTFTYGEPRNLNLAANYRF